MNNLPAVRRTGELAIPEFDINELYNLLPEHIQALVLLYPNEWQRAMSALAASEDIVSTQQLVELFMMLLDDSTSMDDHKNATKAFCQAIKVFLKPFLDKGIVNALVSVWLMNQGPRVNSALVMDAKLPDDYTAPGHTPMHNTMIAALFYQVLLVLWYRKVLGEGVFLRTTTVLFTDGKHSGTETTPDRVKVLNDYLRDERYWPRRQYEHIVIGVGVGRRGTFRAAFLAMGILLEHIYTVNDFREVRAAIASAGKTALARTLASPPVEPIALTGAPSAKPKRIRLPGWLSKSR